MGNLIIYKGEPVYISRNCIDWYLVIKALVSKLQKNGSIIKWEKTYINEYLSRNTIDGITIGQWIKGYDLKIFKFIPLENDWVLQ